MIVLALSAVIASGGSAQAAADVVEIRCDVRTTIQPLTAVDTTTSRQRSWSARDALKMIKPEEIEKWGFDGTRVDWVFYLRINRDTGDGDFLRGDDEEAEWRLAPVDLLAEKFRVDMPDSRWDAAPLEIDRRTGDVDWRYEIDELTSEAPVDTSVNVMTVTTGECETFDDDNRRF